MRSPPGIFLSNTRSINDSTLLTHVISTEKALLSEYPQIYS